MMDVASVLEFLGIVLIATIKFVVALGYLLLPASGYVYYEIVFTLILGGSIGVLFFYYFSHLVNNLITRFFPKKKKEGKFSKKTRRIINIKNKYGLIGISLLTPLILSIPVGCFLASRFYRKKKITIYIMLAGVAFWSFVLPLIKLSY